MKLSDLARLCSAMLSGTCAALVAGIAVITREWLDIMPSCVFLAVFFGILALAPWGGRYDR